jgi:hypothetical protein
VALILNLRIRDLNKDVDISTFEMKPRKNGIWLTVNRVGSPTPEMKLRKNGIWLTVNGLGSPTPLKIAVK